MMNYNIQQKVNELQQEVFKRWSKCEGGPHMEFNQKGGDKKIRMAKVGSTFHSLELRKERFDGS